MKLIAVVGPTCSGKTAKSIELALQHQTEIISADSRQIFKELNIGVARPSIEELNTVPHHFIAEKSILEPYSAGKYEKEALQRIETLFQTKNTVILCGGSTLYIDALLNGLDELPTVPQEIIAEIENNYIQNGLVALQNELKSLDPDYFNTIDIHNHRRVSRALGLLKVSGKKMADLQTAPKKKRNFEIEITYLQMDRNILYKRIEQRCDEMLQNGLLQEVESLIPHKLLSPLNTVGYSEFFDFLEGKLSYLEAVEKFKQHTRNYAKRQITWFNKKYGLKS